MKIKLKFNRIRIRLSFWFMVMGLLPLLVTSAIIYNQRVKSIRSEAFNRLTAVRDLKVYEINQWLDERLGDLYTISEDFELRNMEYVLNKQELSSSDEKIVQNARNLLQRYLKNYRTYNEIFFINPSTEKIAFSTNTVNEGKNKSNDPYFTQPMKTRETYIKDIYYSKTINGPSMTFSTPVFCIAHAGEHITGVLVARVDLERTLYDLLLKRTGMGETGETLIVNRDALALNKLRYDENASLKLKIHAQPAVRASRGNTGVVETVDYSGKKTLAAYTYIPETGWGFVVKQDKNEIYAPIRPMLIEMIIILVISMAVIYLFTNFLAGRISKPILAMTDTAGKIQEGILTARNTNLPDDELGYLGATFNHMADTLNSRLSVQNHIANITEPIVTSAELTDFSKALLKKIVETTGSDMGAFYLRSRDGSRFEHLSSIGVDREFLKPFVISEKENELGRAIAEKSIISIRNIPGDTVFTFRTFAGTAVPKEIITIPVLIKDKIMAAICIASLGGYSNDVQEALNQTWQGIGVALSNILAHEETRRIARELRVKNEEVEAQALELKKQADELQEQNVELETQNRYVEEANRLKTEFLSNMSHELRTPLNSIMALSGVLVSKTGDRVTEEEKNYLKIIKRNGKQLLDLINNILDLSKIEATKMDVYPELFKLGNTIDTVVDNFEHRTGEKGIEIIKKIPEGLPEIESDSSIVQQILQNIIGNAVKFTEKGSVTITVRSDKQKAYVDVTDTGIGISEEDLPHIFDEFRQIDGSSSRRYEGTGLGLAIVLKSAHLLGGDISVKSASGRGSTFTLTLPLKWGESLRPYGEANGTHREIEEREVEEKELQTVRGKKILLTEDNEAAIIQITNMLEGEGCAVDVAHGGEDALKYIKYTIPDGIILDLMMPEVDGFKVLENLRGVAKTANIPVLILTAKDLTSDELSFLSENNVHQLIKKGSVDKSELIFRVKRMFGTEQKAVGTGPAESKKLRKREASEKKKPSGKKSGGCSILIVEDNPDNMTTVTAVLKESYRIFQAIDGEECLQTALSEIPDLILLDIGLPGTDGLMVLKKIKENEKTCRIPIIALTASAMKGDREKIIDEGFEDYISKPLDIEELLSKIEKWMRFTGGIKR